MRNIQTILILIILALPIFAQEYVYPNKKLADEGLLEYRRYTLEEAGAYEKGLDSFTPLLLTGWSDERRLTEDESAHNPKVVTVGDTIFCTYPTMGSSLPHFICSYDQGIDWNNNICLEDTTWIRGYFYPEIANHQDELIIGSCFYEFDQHGYNLGYFRSSDRGVSWSEVTPIFPYYMSNHSNYGSLCNVEQRLYFSYNEYEHDSIYVLISSNWGHAWNGRGVNAAYLSDTPQPMTVRASGNNVYLVWVNEVGTVSCRYSRSTDMGQTWSDEVDISNDSLGAQRVYIAVQDTHVVVCWKGHKYSPYAFTGDLFIKQSFDSGETWSEEQVLTDLHKVMLGSIYIEDSLIIAAWQDARFEGGNNEAIVKYSTDYGLTWTDEQRLSYANYDSHAPIACMTDNKIHVLWGDMRLNAPGLYYCVNDLSTDIEGNHSLPDNLQLLSSYPNPFNSSTVISYSNIEGGEIEIYDICGRLLRTLNAGGGQEGKITWDATNASGEKVSSGIYFARARSSEGAKTAKLIYLK